MDSPLRSFVAVLFGLMAIFVLRMLAVLVLVHHFGNDSAMARQVFVFNLVSFAGAAFLGGVFTAALAAGRRMRHGYVLAIVLLILTIMAASRNPVNGAPIAQALLLLGPPLAAIAGAAMMEWLGRRSAAHR